VTVVLFQS